jgi:hypothetical protein
MKTLLNRLGFVLVAVICLAPSPAEKDLLDQNNGATIVSATSQYNDNWAPRLLLDQSTATGWCNADGSPLPQTIVIELAQASRLAEFVVDNTGAQESGYPGISARRFELWVSVSGSDSGFRQVLTGEAIQGGRRVFPLTPAVEARWLKLVVLSSWGHATYTEIMELEAYGETSGQGGGRQNFLGGAKIVSATSQYNDNWAPRLLLDQSTATGWCNADGSPLPQTIVIELAQASRLTEFAVDNTGTQESGYPGISARRFELWVSTNGSDTDYRQVLSGEAIQGGRRGFPLTPAVKARWLKLVVLSNWGHATYTEIMELEASGELSGH